MVYSTFALLRVGVVYQTLRSRLDGIGNWRGWYMAAVVVKMVQVVEQAAIMS